jgi:hypothetical protein
MSAAEVIEQIKALPREEQREVSEFVRALDQKEEGQATGPRYADDAAFASAIDKVFDKHDELFRKLAQ